jgi:KaiC/GvpD/RAD55 family RecA-like ATPase
MEHPIVSFDTLTTKHKSKYSADEIAQVKSSVTVYELFDHYDHEYADESAKVKCPYHNDGTPSMLVSEESCHCFACAETWDIVDVVMKEEDVGFGAAIDILVDRYNINLKNNKDEDVVKVKPKVTMKKKEKKPAITTEKYNQIIRNSAPHGTGFRGISDETLKRSKVRTEYDDYGEVIARWYLATENFKVVGMKKRECPIVDQETGKRDKKFFSEGRVGITNDLYGAIHYKGGGKTLVIVGGEEDREACIDMVNSSHFRENWYKPAFVSPTSGEGSLKAQLKNNYEWINSFEEIVLALDNDEAGNKAMDECLDVLPKGKVYKILWQEKDPNEYLMKGLVKDFVSDLFNNKRRHIPVGIVSSAEMREAAIEEFKKTKIRLPPFMRKVQEMTNGGFSGGTIINIGGATGIGKTSLIGEAIYFWCTELTELSLPVSLELAKGQYAVNIYSRHLGINLSKNYDKAIDIIKENKEKLDELDYNEDGSPKYFIVDDRDGTIEDVQKKVEEAVVTLGVRLVIFDPLNDLFEGLEFRDQQAFIRWEKRFVKKYDSVTIVNICHFNKAGSRLNKDKDGNIIMPQEADLDGASAIFKSGSVNILMARDKNAEDPEERNKTYATITKGRGGVATGPCGPWYYDPGKHVMYDWEDWQEAHREPNYEDVPEHHNEEDSSDDGTESKDAPPF